jgi:DNA-binding LytR/AlgR family response regulator
MSGTRRLPDWAIAYAVIALATLAINSVNALSLVDDRAQIGQPIAWWKAAVWEGSSGLVLLALVWMPMLAVARFPPDGPRRLRNLAVHLAVSIPFSLAHVGLMIALREAAYALAGEDYRYGSGALFYEYRKDLLSYCVFATTFWMVGRLRQRSDREPSLPPQRDFYEIDEGQRRIRVPKADIGCARSSGNYVEFFLADGRRPLVRTTLAAVEARLAPAGFVRVHKSWLVNSAHVVEAVAEGSGDYGLRLADGTEVPLSRRYPGALASLRLNRAN